MGTIDLITPPTGGAPLTTADYNSQNALIQQLLFQYNLKTLFLSNWDNLTEPKIKQGVSIQHGGSQFSVNTSDVDIAFSPPDGRVYIKLSRVGDQLQAEYITNASGYMWNYIYNGFYNVSGDQVLPCVIRLISGDWYKFDLDGSEDKYNIESKIIKQYISNIGIWDMAATSAVYFSPTLAGSWLRGVKAWVRNDSGDTWYDMVSDGARGAYRSPTAPTFPDMIQLFRGAGFFDLGIFDDDTIDRGYYAEVYEI